jgi:cell division topological specificity factor
MNLFSLFKRRGSAPVARDRLQILLAYERTTRGPSDLLVILREEILAVVGRHVEIDPNRVSVQMDRGDKVSILEVDIEVPNTVRVTSSGSRRKRVTLPVHGPAS